MWNGNYAMGSKIICLACKNAFQQVTCPFCYDSVFWNLDDSKNYFYKQGANVQCFKCWKSFQHITCPCCLSSVYFKECDLFPGKAFRCDTCKNDLFHVRCVKCSFSEIFKNEVGKKYGCRNCKTCYTIYPCLTCNKASNIFLAENQSSILKFVCTSKTCKEFYLYQCKHCSIFSSFLPHYSGCTKEICKSCKKANPIYFCNQCKNEKFCECSINNESKHGCTSCKKELTNSLKGNIDSKSDGLCIIDLTRKIDTVFVPCGHACYCSLCYGKLLSQGNCYCPMCNEKGECIKLHL